MTTSDDMFDVVIIGGGPAGLAAALTLGRACKRVLLIDGGARRNERAAHLQNFVTRDGTPPAEFRAVARAQLASYPNVTIRDATVDAVTGAKDAFAVQAGGTVTQARRLLLCMGMVDEPLAIDGAAERWGHAVFQCPYCHGWEVRDQPWGYLYRPEVAAHVLPFALQLTGWTRDVTVFANGHSLPEAVVGPLQQAGVRVEMAPVVRLHGPGTALDTVELADGQRIACAALYAHPPQHQVPLVTALGLTLEDGLVAVDPMRRETSVPGIYAGGDLTTRMQAAINAASLGMQAAAMINLELSMARATSPGA